MKLAALAIIAGFLWLLLASTFQAWPADLDGRHNNSPLKSWFDSLQSRKGLCCSFVDGVTVKDVDWDSDGTRYRVRLDGVWVEVPDDALLTVPNRYGQAVVWPYKAQTGETLIRCFIPGAGT